MQLVRRVRLKPIKVSIDGAVSLLRERRQDKSSFKTLAIARRQLLQQPGHIFSLRILTSRRVVACALGM